MGSGAAADSNACDHNIVNMAKNTPTAFLFSDSQCCDVVSFCHSPVFCTNDPLQAASFDNHMVAVMGNDSARAIPLTLATAANFCALNAHCLRLPQAAAQFVVAGPVLNQGPHTKMNPDTNQIAVHDALLMPPSEVPRTLENPEFE